jgi:hypothetical protein
MSFNKATSIVITLIPILVGMIWLTYSIQFLDQGIFWDLGIYEKTVAVFNQGGNPYELNGYLSFVYHPLVLRLMALFGDYLGLVLIGAYLLSLLFFLRSLGSNRSWWLYTFLAFAYCGIGTISIGSGNVTVFFHLVLLGILLRHITYNNTSVTSPRPSFTGFILAVLLFSLVKPYLLAYLLIPIVMTWRSNHQKHTWSLILVSVFVLAIILLLSSLYFGTEFQAFLAAVRGQTIGKHDLGYGLVMYFYEYYSSAGPLIYRAFVLHFVILSILIVAILYLAKRSQLIQKPHFVLLLYFLLTILNPRLKVYDLFPALIALFIYASALDQSRVVKALFIFAYALSLRQLAGTPLFAHNGILSDPLNVYYLTMGLILIGLAPNFIGRKPLKT